jgi:hypothetical protein
MAIPPYIHPDRLLKERSSIHKDPGADVGNTPARDMFFNIRIMILGHHSVKFGGNDLEIQLFRKDTSWILFISGF